MINEDIYTYRDFPWLSKSKILGYRFCPHLFDLRYNKGVDLEIGLKASSGLNLHALYAKFFRILNFQDLQKIPINYAQDLEETAIYNYFYKVMMEMIPPDSRQWEPYQLMVKSFCLAEAAHWIDLNQYFKENITKVVRFFIPAMLERYIECPQLLIFGTIDRAHEKHSDPSIIHLLDYKTGHIPVAVKRGIRRMGDPYSWNINYKKSFELHFYLLLWLCDKGYKLDPAIIDYCMNERNFYDGVKFPQVKSYFYDKNNKPFNFTRKFILSIFYTGEGNVWLPQKRPSKRSMRTVFEWINNIRTIMRNGGPYNKEPEYWKCKECNEKIREQCLTEEEEKMIFWEKKDNGDNNSE